VKHAEIDVGRNGIDVARTDEVADERVEQRAIGPDEVDIGKIQECSRAVGDLGFELAQAEFETAAFRKGSIRKGDHGVDPGAGLGRFGEARVVTIRRHAQKLHLQCRNVQMQRDVDRGRAVVDEGLRP